MICLIWFIVANLEYSGYKKTIKYICFTFFLMQESLLWQFWCKVIQSFLKLHNLHYVAFDIFEKP